MIDANQARRLYQIHPLELVIFGIDVAENLKEQIQVIFMKRGGFRLSLYDQGRSSALLSLRLVYPYIQRRADANPTPRYALGLLYSIITPAQALVDFSSNSFASLTLVAKYGLPPRSGWFNSMSCR